MMKRLERKFMGCLMLLLVACQQQEVMENTENRVELTFKITFSDIASRGLADGDCLEVVSVYLVNEDKEIVARQENISIDEGATEKEVKFDKSYNLKRGIHTLLVVANHATLSEWKAGTYEELMNNRVHAIGTTDYISPKDKVQPLSLMKQIELHAGNNEIEGELVRTFARIRIEVRNNSGTEILKISNLTFSDNFTQNSAYVFDDGTDRTYFDPTGAPVATSDYALQPFVRDEEANSKSIAAQTSVVVFDSYLLESQAAEGEKYTYTLDLKYEGISKTVTTYSRTSDTEIDRVNNLNVKNESYYLIYNTNSERYLSAGDDVVETALLENVSDLRTSVVWQVTKNGNSYSIKNVETGEYLQAPDNGFVALGSSQVFYTLEQMESRNNDYIGLLNGNYYVGVYTDGNSWGNNMTYNVQGYNKNSWSSNRYFYFYQVTKTTSIDQDQDITYNTPITLTTIDPITKQATPTTAIKRNDFIHVLVTVSYNPVAGKLEFHVENWKTGGGQVEFN